MKLYKNPVIACIALTLAYVANANAAEYPAKPIRLLQGFAPGGNADIISRIIGEELKSALGQPIVYGSRVGAGGNLAAEAVANSEPDGHSLVLLTTGHSISERSIKRSNLILSGIFPSSPLS
jgi:tripartite-type tricarboxylate transporter receptor subunit TctC